MPFFSVIIPLYNKEKYIQRSFDSVICQSFPDFEILVIDDGSTDTSLTIVKACKDHRLRLICQSNSGVSAARNRGISEACGQWVAFLDADDEYLPTFLEEVHRCIEQFPLAGAVYAEPIWMRGGVQINKTTHPPMPGTLLPDYFDHVSLHDGNEINSSCVAVRKDVFALAGMFPVGVRIGEDSDMWLRLAWTTEIAHIPRGLSIYHMDAGDSQWEANALKDPYWVQTYRQWLSHGRIPMARLKSTETYFQRFILSKALRLILTGNRREACKMMLNDVLWVAVPPRFAFKVLMYMIFPLNQIRSFFRR